MTTTPARLPACPVAAPASDLLGRRLARAIGGFEHALLHRVPSSVTIVSCGDRFTISLHEPFTPLERRLAATPAGRCRIRDLHHDLFAASHEDLLQHVRRSTGVVLDAGIVHVDTATGSVLKTFTTESSVELFLLGSGLPALGVPVNAHVHANGATGTGAGRS